MPPRIVSLFVVFSACATVSFGAPTPAAMSSAGPIINPPTSDDLRACSARSERELRGDILPFWLDHARDLKRGGFVGQVDQDMTVKADAPRGTLLTSRILWTFSAAHRRFHAPEYLEMARWAYRDLVDRGFDAANGGLWWTVTPDGRPVESAKMVYGQSFGVYALAEYYRDTGEKAALERAIALYRLIERKAHDPVGKGYFEAFSRDWHRDDASGHRIMGGTGSRSQNTHIHLLEAYTNLYRVWPDAALRQSLHELLTLMLTRVINPRTHHLGLFFDDRWEPVSEEISFGHDIELSWLLVEAAGVLGDPGLLAQSKTEAVAMARVTIGQGIDADGGVVNEAGPHGLTNSDKDWWPQAEATVGFLNAYQISGDLRFFSAFERSWSFIQTKCIDRINGDWYESLARDGTPRTKAKLSVWKCPYHNSRACLEIIDRVEALEAGKP